MECDEESVSKNTLIQNKNIENKQGELKSSSTKKRLKASDEKTSESENLYSTMKNFNEGISLVLFRFIISYLNKKNQF